MKDSIKEPSSAADRVIETSRLLDFPREFVFEAFRDPKQLAQWWGPAGFTNTFEQFEFKPGGNWRFVMHGPNGANYPNQSTFFEISEPERIVIRHDCSPYFQMTITLADEAGKTRLGWHMLFNTADECAKVKSFAPAANEQNLDRLSAQLAKMSGGQRPFVISRLFDAPRDLVWKAWTESEHMGWWGPKGVTIQRPRLDLRPGGLFHYCMKTPDGREMWGKWVIREVAAPERLVFVNSFSDESAGTTRHPMSPTWPLETLSTAAFTEKNGKTLLTIMWLPINADEAERKTFDEGHDSMKAGWTGTLDRLDEHLAEYRAAGKR